MRQLFLVAESPTDAAVFAALAMRVRGETMAPVPFRNRCGDGFDAVKRQLRYALVQARAAAGSGDVALLAACDNDRSPHPENATTLDRRRLPLDEQARGSRRDWMLTEVERVFGANRARWPLPLALAVPVEMLECWIMRSVRAEPQPPRHFSRAESESARRFYHPSPAPPQWKDLCDEEQAARGLPDRYALFLQVAQQLDPAALAARSRSFAEFKEWLDAWPAAHC